MGLRRVIPNLRTVCYVEVEAFACANLVSKIEAGKLDAAPIWTDIKTFDGEPFRNRVHIITAGYPCQGESHAGKRLGKKDPRWLWPHIERIIEAVQPVWFFGENVSGHLSLGFPEVYRSLRNLGYKIEAGLFTAAEVGAPHKRERLFILAYNGSWGRGIRTDKTERQEMRGQTGIIEGSCELANCNRAGCKEQRRPESIRQKYAPSECCRWPSRPGQPQYEWEEPRVIMGNAESRQQRREQGCGVRTGQEAENKRQGNNNNADRPSAGNVDDTKGKRSKRVNEHRKSENETPKSRGQANGRDTESSTTSKGQTQSRLGRAANGTRSRVDRLRLLGNGVVPQQAELAFRALMTLFQKK